MVCRFIKSFQGARALTFDSSGNPRFVRVSAPEDIPWFDVEQVGACSCEEYRDKREGTKRGGGVPAWTVSSPVN